MALFYDIENDVCTETKKDNIKEYFRNEVIFKRDSLVSSIAIIKRGAILIKENNKEIKKLEKNAVIGLSLIFSSYPFYDYDYIALSNVSLKIVYKEELLNNNLKDNLNIMQLLSDYIINVEIHNKMLLTEESKRLPLFLYLEHQNKNSTSFYIEYSKNDLSKYLGISNQYLTLKLKELKNKNIIKNENKLYQIINLDKLKEEIE